MALGGSDNNIPPPPPPPGAPPPPGGAGTTGFRFPLRPEVEAEVMQLRALVASFKERHTNGDASALQELKDLRVPYTQRWKDAKARFGDDRLKMELERAQRRHSELTTDAKVKAQAFHVAAEQLEMQIEQTTAQQAAFANNPRRLAIINEKLTNEYPLRQAVLEQKIQQELAIDAPKLAEVEALISNLEAELKVAEREIFQFYILDSTLNPPFIKNAPAQEAPVAKKPEIDITKWYNEHLIDGIFFDNLRQFIITREDHESGEDITKYTVPYVLGMYTQLASTPDGRNLVKKGFDHIMILGIAAGYITRDFMAHPYLEKMTNPLEFVLQGEDLEALPDFADRQADLYERLEALYVIAPEFNPDVNAQTGHTVASSSSAPATGRAISQHIEQAVSSLSRMPGTSSNRSRPSSSHSSSSSSSSSSTAPLVQPRTPGPTVAEVEARRAQADQEAKANHGATGVRIGQRGPNLNLAQALTGYQQVAQQAAEFLDAHVARITELLGIKEQHATMEDALTSAAVKIEELQEKLESPVVILQREWATNRTLAFNHAFESYKKSHGNQAPSVDEMKSWARSAGLRGSEFNIFQDSIRNAPK